MAWLKRLPAVRRIWGDFFPLFWLLAGGSRTGLASGVQLRCSGHSKRLAIHLSFVRCFHRICRYPLQKAVVFSPLEEHNPGWPFHVVLPGLHLGSEMITCQLNLYLSILNWSHIICAETLGVDKQSPLATHFTRTPFSFATIGAPHQEFFCSSNFPDNTMVYCISQAPGNTHHTLHWSHRSLLPSALYDGQTLS